MELLKGLSSAQLDALREAFTKKDVGLEREEFADVVARYTPRPPGYLRSLFRTIDYSGTHRVTWDEFTTYAIDSHMKDTAQRPTEWLAPYTCKQSIECPDTVLKVAHIKHWGPDGRIATFSRGPKPLKMYNTKTMELIKAAGTDQVGGCGTVMCAEFHPGINMLMCCSTDGQMRVLDRELNLRSEMRLGSLNMKMEYLAHADLMFGATRSGCLVTYEMGRSYDLAGKPTVVNSTTYNIHESRPLTDFQFHPHNPDGVFTCSLDGDVRLFHLDVKYEGEAASHVLGRHENGVLALSYSADYNYVCSVGYEPEVMCWVNMPQAREQRMVLVDHSTPHKDSFAGIHAVPGTAELLTCDLKGYVKVWDLRMFRCVQTFLMGWSPDEAYPPPATRATMCYSDRTRQLFCSGVARVCAHEQEGTGRLREESTAIILYNATQRVFVTASGRHVKLWNVADGCLSSHFCDVAQSDITALAIDEHGRRLYIGANDGSVCCRVFATCELLYQFTEEAKHASEVCGLAYVRGKAAIFSAATDGSVLLHLDRDEGRVCAKVQTPGEDHTQPVQLLASPSLQLVAMGRMASVTLRDLSNSKEPISEVRLPYGTTLTAMTFLESKAALAIALDNGRFLLFSVRPLGARNLQTGVADMAPAVLARWANVPHVHAQAWACRERVAQLAAEREAAASEFPTSFQPRSGEADDDADDNDPFERVLRSPELAPRSADVLGEVPPYYTSLAELPSCAVLYYDSASHVLWAGDTEGMLTAWQLCGVFKHHALHDISYPVKVDHMTGQVPEYVYLSRALPCHDLDDRVPILRSFRAHADEVRYLTGHSESGILASSADDARVLLWDCAGTLLAELSYQRSYARYGATVVPKLPEPWNVDLDHHPSYTVAACVDVPVCLDQFVDADKASDVPVTLLKLLRRLDWGWHGSGDAPAPHKRWRALDAALSLRGAASIPGDVPLVESLQTTPADVGFGGLARSVGSLPPGASTEVAAAGAASHAGVGGTVPPPRLTPAGTPAELCIGASRITAVSTVPPGAATASHAAPCVSYSRVCGHPVVAVADNVPGLAAVARLASEERDALLRTHPFAPPAAGDSDSRVVEDSFALPSDEATACDVRAAAAALEAAFFQFSAVFDEHAQVSGGQSTQPPSMPSSRINSPGLPPQRVSDGSQMTSATPLLTPMLSGRRGSSFGDLGDALRHLLPTSSSASPVASQVVAALHAQLRWRGEVGVWVTPEVPGGVPDTLSPPPTHGGKRSGGTGSAQKQRPPLAHGTPRHGTANSGRGSDSVAGLTSRPPSVRYSMSASPRGRGLRRAPFAAHSPRHRDRIHAESGLEDATVVQTPHSTAPSRRWSDDGELTPIRHRHRSSASCVSDAESTRWQAESPAAHAGPLHQRDPTTSPPRVRGLGGTTVVRATHSRAFKNQIDISCIGTPAAPRERVGGVSSEEECIDDGWWSVGAEKKWSNRAGKVVTNEFLVQASPVGRVHVPKDLPVRAPPRRRQPPRGAVAAHEEPPASAGDGAAGVLVRVCADEDAQQRVEDVEEIPTTPPALPLSSTPSPADYNRCEYIRANAHESPSRRALRTRTSIPGVDDSRSRAAVVVGVGDTSPGAPCRRSSEDGDADDECDISGLSPISRQIAADAAAHVAKAAKAGVAVELLGVEYDSPASPAETAAEASSDFSVRAFAASMVGVAAAVVVLTQAGIIASSSLPRRPQPPAHDTSRQHWQCAARTTPARQPVRLPTAPHTRGGRGWGEDMDVALVPVDDPSAGLGQGAQSATPSPVAAMAPAAVLGGFGAGGGDDAPARAPSASIPSTQRGCPQSAHELLCLSGQPAAQERDCGRGRSALGSARRGRGRHALPRAPLLDDDSSGDGCGLADELDARPATAVLRCVATRGVVLPQSSVAAATGAEPSAARCPRRPSHAHTARVGHKERGGSAPAQRPRGEGSMWCRTLPSVTDLLKQRRATAGGGSRRYAPVGAADSPVAAKDTRTRTTVHGGKVKVKHLHALSNAHIPLTARLMTGTHSAVLSPRRPVDSRTAGD